MRNVLTDTERMDQHSAGVDRHINDVDLIGLTMGTDGKEHGPATFLHMQLLTKTERTRPPDEQFSRFIDIMKKLYINVPFLDALQVPTYTKYIKEIMQIKNPLPSEGVVKMKEEMTMAISDVAPRKCAPGLALGVIVVSVFGEIHVSTGLLRCGLLRARALGLAGALVEARRSACHRSLWWERGLRTGTIRPCARRRATPGGCRSTTMTGTVSATAAEAGERFGGIARRTKGARRVGVQSRSFTLVRRWPASGKKMTGMAGKGFSSWGWQIPAEGISSQNPMMTLRGTGYTLNLIIECATMMEQGMDDEGNDVINFHVRDVAYSIGIRELAMLFDFDEEAPVHSVAKEELDVFWFRIADQEERKRGHIKNPMIQVLHRWIAARTTGWVDSTNISDIDLRWLYNAIVDPCKCNPLPSMVASWF
ncbi:hypothetical protein PR202_ga03526 [Eleusine coracana subsp. coracana]|uniref:Arabidopsis retrotransposon Orf1 C-terminal domain-containing protein n=1 Tax=Eleusine coracana subsp. coracana TaxID=191504 RepID=A0AAV5BPA7_ELECO|nr:hypothetical protein PR202_ga03526 [Eleusine coracana subsp. coracana]